MSEQKISISNGKLVVPDSPTIPFIEGDGTGVDIWPACLNKEEQKLYELMMDYRKSKGLPSIPISAKLSLVAQTHARDLMATYKFDVNNKCNPHSWSKKREMVGLLLYQRPQTSQVHVGKTKRDCRL